MYCMWTCVSCVVRTNGAKYMHAYVRHISKYLFIYLFTYLYFIFSAHYILHIYNHKYIYTYYVQFCGIPSDSCRIFSSSTSRSKRPGTVANLIPGFAHEDLWPNPNALAPSGGCPLSLSMYTHIYIYRASMQFSVNIPECVVECNLTYV